MKLCRVVLLLAGASSLLQAQNPKLDSALSQLLESVRGGFPAFTNGIQSEFSSTLATQAMYDAQGRILVDIHLDGTASLNQFTAGLTAAGAAITGVNPAFRFGAVSAFVPVNNLETIARLGGLARAKMTRRPMRNAGAVTSQGVKALRSDVANGNGFNGTGITVGVLSDSYDTSPVTFTAVRAADDIAGNDLPAPKLIVDRAPASGNTDEGRAMMQIVHDVAPNAALCFETAATGETAFAANIRDLRTNPACLADVIVDDVFYFDEPFFSDGQVAQAVNDVVTSNVLAGKKVTYFSSAGNQGSAGGRGSIDVPNAGFSTTPSGLGNINLATIATCASSPGAGSTKADATAWLDFGGGNFFHTVNYSTSGSTMILQWDDLFYQGSVTTDLNWYMFNSSGNCVFTFAANNIAPANDNGVEVIGLSGGASGAYRIMIGRTGAGTNQATHVRMVTLRGWSGGGFAITGNPVTFGHSSASKGISVAAYVYSAPFTANPVQPAFENLSSPGPATIHFGAAGNRLPFPEIRKKPDIAAPDGGDTTFFFPGSDPDATGFPNFFGTSAAAPHAAGVAALLLQKAGGPGSLTPAQIRSIMQTTAPPRVPPITGGPAAKGYNKFDGFGLIDAVLGLAKIP